MIKVFNDTVSCAMASDPSKIEGIVVIVGTGSIVCGFRENEENVTYRAGGWGPLLDDRSSGFAIGSHILRQVALYHDLNGWQKNENKNTNANKNKNKNNNFAKENKNEYGPNEQIILAQKDCSEYLYNKVIEFTGISKFDEIIDWAYKGVDFKNGNIQNVQDVENKEDNNTTSDSYERVAKLAKLAIENYSQDKVCEKVINSAISNLIRQLIIVMDQVYPKSQVLESKNSVNIICGGSILTKTDVFLNIFEKQLRYTLGGDSRQAFLKFIRPKIQADVGAALYIKHCCQKSTK